MKLHLAGTLAATASPGEHLQAAGMCLMAAVVCIWAGRRQRRTGRHFFAAQETVRVGHALVSPPAPTRGNRVRGRIWAGLGWFFVVPFVVQLSLAIRQIV
ncbi:hypothetical protein LG634_21605 [Streptomyces bambusae]|uniref:hypothetical protein n=1 Tax=Streptomyces bambusae TaxID=1550616 RepID=UPI001CFCCD82|nr:hypothetical protein [Streptomyces bambusae]MCB5167415.1 hypothetical protein [Streptomyces bambusae]